LLLDRCVARHIDRLLLIFVINFPSYLYEASERGINEASKQYIRSTHLSTIIRSILSTRFHAQLKIVRHQLPAYSDAGDVINSVHSDSGTVNDSSEPGIGGIMSGASDQTIEQIVTALKTFISVMESKKCL